MKRAEVAAFLGLKRNLVLFLAAVILIGAGEETWMRFVPKYLEALGASAAVIGLYDGLKTLLGAVYAYPGGALVDRFGHRRALVGFTVASVAGYLLVLLVPHWVAVICGMFLFLAWTSLSLPAMFTLVAETLGPEKHAMGIGMQSLMKRVPMVIGPLAGGILIDRFGLRGGVRIGLALSIAMGMASIGLQSRLEEKPIAAGAAGGSFRAAVMRFSPHMRWLLFSDILVRFCERLPYAWVVIYAMDYAGVSGTGIGILTALEMVVAMASYVPVAHLAERFGKEPFVIATFAFFTVFPLSLVFAHGFGMLLVAFAIRGLKEFGDPARKALIVAYADPEARGRSVGAYYLIRDVVVSLGSMLGAALWSLGPAVNFWTAFALGMAGTAVYVTTLRLRAADGPRTSFP